MSLYLNKWQRKKHNKIQERKQGSVIIKPSEWLGSEYPFPVACFIGSINAIPERSLLFTAN